MAKTITSMLCILTNSKTDQARCGDERLGVRQTPRQTDRERRRDKVIKVVRSKMAGFFLTLLI